MGKKISLFLEKFRRVTSGGYYMPEIDGLRFIAVFWVAALMHTTNFINVKFYDSKLLPSYAAGVAIEGGYGVSLFFIISGFILAFPFATQYLQNGKKVALKEYYLRRVTRLEPPYLAALLIAFVGLVFINKKFSFGELLPHLGASAIYSHQYIYGERSWVLGVAWSLEVEIQFYIVAPLMAFIYRIRQARIRYLVFSILITVFSIYAFNRFWSGQTGIQYSMHCFLLGMLLCDLYINGVRLKGNENYWFGAALLLFLLMPLLISIYDMPSYLLKHLLLALAFFVGITNSKMKKLLSLQIISIIGGMCYSIYLIHFMIMSTAFPLLQKIVITNHWIAFGVYFLLIIILVLVGGMVFYKFIEQPCMKKDWYKKLFRKTKTAAR
ncbi:MAG: acyltransferase [Chitinophagaceae bacterium]